MSITYYYPTSFLCEWYLWSEVWRKLSDGKLGGGRVWPVVQERGRVPVVQRWRLPVVCYWWMAVVYWGLPVVSEWGLADIRFNVLSCFHL